MKTVGTIARGIRTQVIKQGDDLANIVVKSVMAASKESSFELKDKDIIAITEAVVGISAGNYATTEQIATDVKSKLSGDHIGIVYPILSRNRFSILLRAFAKSTKKLTVLLSYPQDEVGNAILDVDKLKSLDINPYSDLITEDDYKKHFSDFKHEFTGVNMVEYYRDIVTKESCEVTFVFSNNPNVIKNYTNQVIVANIHSRNETKKLLKKDETLNVIGLDDILTYSVDGSGFNKDFGLLGSNTASETKVKLFPYDAMPLLLKIQKEIYDLTSKHVEVMIYGDGAFKDPTSGIWELADPMVSPYFTDGLKGSPNELKLKLLVDNKYSDLTGQALTDAIKYDIKNKDTNLTGKNESLGTTPRRYVDLIGSLCDLMSGSGDKGTPVILVQNYFTNYTGE